MDCVGIFYLHLRRKSWQQWREHLNYFRPVRFVGQDSIRELLDVYVLALLLLESFSKFMRQTKHTQHALKFKTVLKVVRRKFRSENNEVLLPAVFSCTRTMPEVEYFWRHSAQGSICIQTELLWFGSEEYQTASHLTISRLPLAIKLKWLRGAKYVASMGQITNTYKFGQERNNTTSSYSQDQGL